MRVHRHDDDGIELGVHDRPARRQRVGGRAGRGGDDQAVGFLAADELAIDVDLEFDHPRRLARVQYHVVERVALADGFGMPAYFGLEQEAVFHQVMAVEHFGDLYFQLVRADIGEKAQAATVDAQHRRVVLGQGPGGAEQAAIAANDDDQVTDLTQQLARRGLQAVAGQDFSDRVFEDDVQMPFQQEFFQSANSIEHLRATEAADDTDIAKLLHGAPARRYGG
ncbi:hypothetical protein D3C77_339790 [compost metagenome]